MIHLLTKFHFPSSSNPLLITIRPKAKPILHVAVMFYILQEDLNECKLHIFWRSVTTHSSRILY